MKHAAISVCACVCRCVVFQPAVIFCNILGPNISPPHQHPYAPSIYLSIFAECRTSFGTSIFHNHRYEHNFIVESYFVWRRTTTDFHFSAHSSILDVWQRFNVFTSVKLVIWMHVSFNVWLDGWFIRDDSKQASKPSAKSIRFIRQITNHTTQARRLAGWQASTHARAYEFI